ncbi:MAG: chorismate synthase, partial [Candidatus Diapherotrites archaeon]|nr:chorismate synthase [Candidatus Diapherotrites archaeon]
MTGNTFGKLFKVTSFGESHGIGLGVIIDGCPPGIPLSVEEVQKDLDRRRPGQSAVTTSRGEEDKVEIVSGIFEGKTTGAPIAMIVINRDMDSSKYEKLKDVFRPGHADFTYFAKYGIRDYKGSGRASGRETWSRVAAGAVAKKILAQKGVKIFGHTVQVGKIHAEKFDEKFIEQNPV